MHLFFDELLAEARRAYPRQYALFFRPDSLTITVPISLELVRIPAGEFRMGSDPAEDEDAEEDELPPHCVHVPEFYVGKYPVANMQYLHCVRVTGHRAPRSWEGDSMPRRKASHPVAGGFVGRCACFLCLVKQGYRAALPFAHRGRAGEGGAGHRRASVPLGEQFLRLHESANQLL
jgi:hypothetical protein